jgi:2'-5' RNA ligase
MRLFTGIAIPSELARSLEKLMDQLRPLAPIRWSKSGNLHITTKFIGEWPEERLGELQSGLDTLPTHSPIPISVQGLGWFPNPHRPRVFWAAIQAPPALAELAAQTEALLEGLGVRKETRGFSPHLTLARIEGAPDLGPLRRAVAQLPGYDFGTFQAHCFYLYRSQPSSGGSNYSKIAEFRLDRGTA